MISSSSRASRSREEGRRNQKPPDGREDCQNYNSNWRKNRRPNGDGSYGVEADLICSFPIHSDGAHWSIVPGVPVNDFSRTKINASVKELQEERALASEQLPG